MRPAWRGLGLAVATAFLCFSLHGLDPARTRALLGGLGPALLLVPLPFLATLLLDTLAWRQVMAAQGSHATYFQLLRVRVRSEALVVALPSGSLMADGLSARWLHSDCGLSGPRAAAAVLARKCLLPLSQALFVGVGAMLLWSEATPASWRALAVVSMLVLLIVGSIGLTCLSRGGLATGARLVERLPWPRLRHWARRGALALAETDAHLARGLTRAVLPPIAAFWCCHALDAFETWLLLRLVGCPLAYLSVWPAEAVLSFVRVLGFWTPAGLGLQDGGYVLFLQSTGVAEATNVAAAFLILKRAKEVLWVLVGLALRGPSASPGVRTTGRGAANLAEGRECEAS